MTSVSPDKSFDLLAAQYECARPGYPEALYDRIVAYASLQPGARLLEIATGTGKATLPLAQRGYRILCVEPGANLAAIARMQLAAFPEVEVQTVSFEDWAPTSWRAASRPRVTRRPRDAVLSRANALDHAGGR